MLGKFFRKDKSNISDNQNEKVKFLNNKKLNYTCKCK